MAKFYPRLTTGFSVNIFRLGACLKCRGDLVYDEGDWLCLQCGVYYYTGLFNYQNDRRDGTLRIARIYPGIRSVDGWTDVGLAS